MKKLTIASVILLPIVIWLVLKFALISPEERIRKVIDRLVEAVEEENIEEALRHVSKDYGDEMGLDYFQMEAFLGEMFEQYDRLRVFLSDIDVEADHDAGTVFLKVAMLGRFDGNPVFVVGSFNQPMQARILFKKEEQRWKMVEAAER